MKPNYSYTHVIKYLNTLVKIDIARERWLTGAKFSGGPLVAKNKGNPALHGNHIALCQAQVVESTNPPGLDNIPRDCWPFVYPPPNPEGPVLLSHRVIGIT